MGAQAVRLSNVDIDNALKNKDFEVLFQPIFDLGNGALARVETFVRWRHPKLGLLPPGAFISFFESQGRMSELTRYVLGSALQSYLDWRGPWPPGLSVNLALSDLSDDAFTTHFTKLLRDNEFPADLVTLECPMPQVDMPIETAAAHFERLASTGARLAIEVRGRANDLLRSLDPFPFDEIKTGGSAILRFARTVRGPGLSAIADLLDVANDANAAITAVGVEDQASLSALRGLGFTAAQGNHLGKVGNLKDFRPQRINEVRGLLELEPLSAENLTALFRTEAPAAQAAETPATQKSDGKNEDALLERLNERVAQYDAPQHAVSQPAEPSSQKKQEAAQTTEAPAAEKTEAKTDQADADKKAKAREKAKALILAKRAKARAARKAAAIERAKAKAAGRPADDVTDVPEESVAATAPREMQERLNRAFTTEDSPESPAGTPLIITQQEIAAPPPAPAAQAQQAAPAKPASTVERAMAQQESIRQTANAGAGASAAAMSTPVSLAVGAAGAYFQPGIRVGAPALLGEPDKPIAASGLDLPPAQARAPEQEAAPPASRQTAPKQEAPQQPASVADTPATPVQEDNEQLRTAPLPPATQVDEPDMGDLHKEASVKPAPVAAPRPRRQKPFLKRTVVPISKHFWPRSWRRAWRRRAASQQAETQAAE